MTEEKKDISKDKKQEEPLIDKEELYDWLKNTAKDLWKVWKTLFKPISKFINKKYEKLPEDQKKNIERMKKDLKQEFGKVKTMISEIWTPPSQRKSNQETSNENKEKSKSEKTEKENKSEENN